MTLPQPILDAKRRFHSSIPSAALHTIQAGSLKYTYKDIEMIKNPFDLALYMQLIWQEKPATILEVGSNKGGSALWFADQMSAYGLKPNVISIDSINPIPDGVAQTSVRFMTKGMPTISGVLFTRYSESIAASLAYY